MRELNIPNTEYVIMVQPNGHLMFYIRDMAVGHIQFKMNATDDEIIEVAKDFFMI